MSDSSALSFPFDDGNIVRFVGSPETPEWVAADIVSILYPNSGASDRTNLLKGVSNDWKGMKPVHTPGGVQNMITLFEPGLYSLIVRSNSPIAVRFQRWVFEDVLPSIRQTGSYSISQSTSVSTTHPPDREKLENIRLGMDLLYELGGVDERTQLALRDIVRDILLEDKLKKPALPSGGRAEWPISDRARHLGYKPKRGDLIKMGRIAADLYRLRHEGDNPPEREQFVDGTTRMVKCYGESDLDIVDQAIALVMEPPAQLPPSIDDDDEF
jgi:prophage antirepressor-like protein